MVLVQNILTLERHQSSLVMTSNAPRMRQGASGLPLCGHESGPSCCLDKSRRRQKRPAWGSLNRSLVPANNRAIRKQLWSVYTMDYKRGIQNCWIDALATADATPAVIGNTFDAIVRCHIAAGDDKDLQLAYQAKDAYGKALATLSHSLSTLPASMTTNKHNTQGILIGMLLVGLCQWQVFDPDDYYGQPGWTLHYKASQNFVKTLGPSAFDANDHLDMNLLQVTWFLNFLSSLALRRHMTLDLKTWDSFSAPMCEGPQKEVFGFLRSWYRMMVPIPRRLEEIDTILATGERAGASLEQAVQKLVVFSKSAEAWTMIHTGPTEADMTAIELDTAIEEHFFLSVNTAFSRQYCFFRQEMAMLWLVTWLSRLITDCTALHAVRACPELLADQALPNLSILEQNASLAAANLARSVYSLSRLSSVTYATILSVVLEVLAAFFADRGAMKELGWCQGCKAATDLRLQRLQKVRPRTLCRIREVLPQLVAAVSAQPRVDIPSKSHHRERTLELRCPMGFDGVSVS